MTEQVFATADKLSKVIKNIQTCLQCMICLHTISNPVRTLCGHRFCHTCIQTVLQNKNASCPLCNSALHRRAISTDEDMKMYIDRLDRLIKAIEKDSGIDISSYLDKPRNTKENHSPVTANNHHEENIQPSCSGMNLTLKKHENPRIYRNVQKQKRMSKESNKKRKNSENSDILKYLSKYSISGVEPLSAESTNDDQDHFEKDKNSKVHSWLNTLPETEAFDDPDKITPEHPDECNLDDTLTMSVSQRCKDNKLEDYEAEEQQQHQSPLRRSLPNNEDKDNEEDRGPSRSFETSNRGSKTELPDKHANPRPSTFGITKSSEECKERSTEVQRTSPCDMLPSMKKKWSSVIEFAKEMRSKKKKKLKSLNVSKSRSHEEIVAVEGARELRGAKDARREKESSMPSGVFKDHSKEEDLPRRKSVESRKDSEASTNMVRSIIDLRNLEKSLPNVEERRKSIEESIERSNMPIDITGVAADRSNLDKSLPNDEEKSAERLENSDEVPTLEESSFIVLEEGEQVRIRNLDSHQMNDIIGIAADDVEAHPDASSNKDQMESTLPLKKRRNMSRTPPSKLPIEATPKKMTSDQSPSNAMNESISKCQSVTSQTSNRGRLSLTRRSTDLRSNDFSASNGASRLSTAKRDLNRQIDEGLNNSASKKAMEYSRRENRSLPTRIEEHKGDRSLVSFKKLGRIFKNGKKRTKFLYLGSTSRESLLSFNVESKELCNFVDYVNTPCYQNIKLQNTFGSSIHVTVNDSMMVTEDNPKDLTMPKAEPVMKTKDVAGEATTKQNNPKETAPATSDVQKPCSLDVVFVSIDENEEETQPRVESTSSNTVSKSTVKLMSPSNDSQLKYLSFDSPTSFVGKTSKSDRIEAVKVTDHNRDNFSEVNGEHSKALIRKASGSSDNDSHCDLTTKRKRSKKMSTDEEGDGSESDHSFQSKSTCIKGSKKEMTRKKDENVLSEDDASLSSDSDILNSHLEKHKKVYRIRTLSARCDIDSSNLLVKNRKDSADSPPSKRKRTASPDSDYEVELKSLVNSWCEDLNISDKKKSKLEAARAKPPEVYKALSASNSANVANTRSSQPRHLSEFAFKLAAEERDKVAQVDQDSPDFGATIDKIQNIRNSTTTSGNGDNKTADAKEVTMTDNFNELNFDTNAFDDYLEAHEIKTALKQDEPDATGSSNARSSNKNVMLAHRSSSSDKENKCIGKRMLYGYDSDDDTILVKDNKTNDKVKPLESTSEQLKRISGTDKSSTRNAMTSDNEKRADGLQENVDDDDLATKEVDYEQDSLMNVTEHDLLIKQFEEDLFGKPLFSSNLSGLKGQEQKTPQKMNNRNKDTEHSADEDDIVENTPDTKTKNSIREGSVLSSPIRSTITSTPCSRKSIHPLHQSTPKVQQSSLKIKCNSAIKPAPINNESSLRRLKTTLGIINNSNTQRLCFVCSGLVLSQVEQVKKLAQMMNAKYLTQFEEEVTHVIVKVDEKNNGASKTLKYLQGIAHRKWIVSYQWVIDSLKEKKLVNEERYEAVDCITLEPGPRNSRLRQKGLFEGFAFLCIGPYCDVSSEQYQDLLRATGGTIVDSLNALTAEKSKLKLIVIQSDIHTYEDIMEWYRKTGAVPIIHDWVVQCISEYKLISFYPYLQELSSQEVLALGFPDFLVEGEPDEDSDSSCNTSM